MAIARRLIVHSDHPGFYHCLSRCVRRAFLCGGDFDHRRYWIRDQLQELARHFAVDVAAYAVMSNHIHVVVRTRPDLADTWSNDDVVKRWAAIFPASVRRWAAASIAPTSRPGTEPPLADAITIVALDRRRVRIMRDRLADLGWFMKCLKEPIARRANREDGCTGCFWEGRFKSHALLDLRAVLACMVYVDLNLIRAGIEQTPEESECTSVQDRIVARQIVRRRARTRSARARVRARRGLIKTWLAPIQRAAAEGQRGLFSFSLDHYLRLVDETGRLARSDKGGRISSHLRPILERLDIDADSWISTMRTPGRMRGTVIGSAGARMQEALRRGTRWVMGALELEPSTTPTRS